jgi:ATP-binding cassette subfamily F protein 3
MELIAPAHVDSPFHFSLREPAKLPDPLLRLHTVAAGYGGTTVIGGVEFSLSPGERIGLLGPNGAGKSTLIKLLAGVIEPQQGAREPAQDLQIGYFAQHQVEQLDAQASPLAHLLRIDPKAREQELRDYLGGFGFPADQALAPTGPFSGGEKSRLALALLVYRRPNLLLLDEPTNHLDLEMRQALAMALQDFAGAMVLVSHDRHLLRVTSDRLVLVYAGRVEEFPGSLEEYPQWLTAQNRQSRAVPASTDSPDGAARRKERRRQEAEQRRQLQPLREKISKLEAALAVMHARQHELEQCLADPGLYRLEDKCRLTALLREKADIDRESEALEGEWLEACELLEARQGE